VAAARPPARKAPPPDPKDPAEQFGEAFIADFLAAWRAHGVGAIKAVAAERPQDFVRAALAILPREAFAKVQAFDDLDDEQLAARVRKLQQALADAGLSGERAGEAGAPPPPSAGPL
jgi:uncharacterized protein YgbK (DUF1537 family)